MNQEPQLNDPLIDLKSVMRLTQASKAKIYRCINAGKFPRPIKFVKRNLWPVSEINAWVEELKNTR